MNRSYARMGAHRHRRILLALPVGVTAATALVACASSSSSSSSDPSSATPATSSAPSSPAASSPAAVTASGFTGTFGTIKRSDGSIQATLHGRPLYTYVADTAPGQATGNGVNAFGGLWHEVPTSAAAAPAASTSGQGGVGY